MKQIEAGCGIAHGFNRLLCARQWHQRELGASRDFGTSRFSVAERVLGASAQ